MKVSRVRVNAAGSAARWPASAPGHRCGVSAHEPAEVAEHAEVAGGAEAAGMGEVLPPL
jgi:hypothetical protein